MPARPSAAPAETASSSAVAGTDTRVTTVRALAANHQPSGPSGRQRRAAARGRQQQGAGADAEKQHNRGEGERLLVVVGLAGAERSNR